MNPKTRNYDFIAAIIFAVLVASTIVLQIATSRNTNSPLVITLFNVLQFIFSIIFAWILTRYSAKKEFEETQKKFAVAAYRRMLQLRETLRFLEFKIKEKTNASQEMKRNFDSIEALTFGIEQTINSSISDWADIISDEIATMHELEQLKKEQDLFLSDQNTGGLERVYKESLKQLVENHQKQIVALTKKLPPTLRSTSEEEENPGLHFKDDTDALTEELKNKGHIELTGFWDPSFPTDIYRFKVGDTLVASVDDIADRTGILAAHDQDGKGVGVLTNKVTSNYRGFVMVVLEVMRKSKFDVVITDIRKKPSGDRHYFKVITA